MTKLTDEQILEKAIKKAVKNGYKGHTALYASNSPTDRVNRVPIVGFIFSHSFAKAFWGKRWQFCIQRLAASKDRLK